jgi:hypothetical protein
MMVVVTVLFTLESPKSASSERSGMDISKQFHGEMGMAKWIEDSFKLVGPLVNKIKIPEGTPAKVFDFWMIGPLKDKPGKLFLYGARRVSFTEEIRSINPIGPPELLVVTGYNTVRKLDINRSATRIAQTLDMLLHGHYTDVPPIHIDSILSEVDKHV